MINVERVVVSMTKRKDISKKISKNIPIRNTIYEKIDKISKVYGIPKNALVLISIFTGYRKKYGGNLKFQKKYSHAKINSYNTKYLKINMSKDLIDDYTYEDIQDKDKSDIYINSLHKRIWNYCENEIMSITMNYKKKYIPCLSTKNIDRKVCLSPAFDKILKEISDEIGVSYSSFLLYLIIKGFEAFSREEKINRYTPEEKDKRKRKNQKDRLKSIFEGYKLLSSDEKEQLFKEIDLNSYLYKNDVKSILF